jgi:hypothetical protein
MTAFLLIATLSMAGAQQKQDMALNQKIAAAREKAIGFLKKQQDPNGSWEQTVLNLLDMQGGTTGLASLALLEAGVPAKDPALARGVDYLVQIQPKKTYVVSLQTQVLARADSKKHAELIQRNADWLIENAIKKEGRLIGWSYPGHDLPDNSNTHFAVVALHAAAQAGAKVDAKIWGQIRDMYLRGQTENGWGYYNNRAFAGERATSSMTTCALVALTLTSKHDKNAKETGEAFERGMVALFKLPESGKSVGYDRMAMAELGRALGVIEFTAGNEKKAWYREAAEKLLSEQGVDGSFAGKSSGIDGSPVLSTAFGLYFLGPPPKS